MTATVVFRPGQALRSGPVGGADRNGWGWSTRVICVNGVAGAMRSHSRYALPEYGGQSGTTGGLVSGVEVEPDVLRTFSGCVDQLSVGVSESRLPGAFTDLAACMPGS